MTLSMSADLKVSICFIGDVSHFITEMHSRPIRGMKQQLLKNGLELGIKPLHQYLKKLNDLDPQRILSSENYIRES